MITQRPREGRHKDVGRAVQPRHILLDAFLRGHLVWEECKGVIYLDCVPKYLAEYFLEAAFTKSELKLLQKLLASPTGEQMCRF